MPKTVFLLETLKWTSQCRLKEVDLSASTPPERAQKLPFWKQAFRLFMAKTSPVFASISVCDHAKGIDVVAWVPRLTTVNMHGRGWKPSIRW